MKRIIILFLVSVLLLTTLTSCFTVKYITPQDSSATAVSDETTETLINTLAPRLLRANVVVSAAHYSLIEQTTSQGSGVIFHTDAKYLYILTNHHVVYCEDARRSVYTVRDAYDNTHTATLVVADASYDLAVVRITRNETTELLNVAQIADANAPIDTAVISVGNPGGVHNSVSIGKIIYMKNIPNDELDIEVAYHTAPLEHGSSGGGIFDSDGNLVGINYAVGTDSETGRQMSFAVPVEAIRTFLAANGIVPTPSTK